MRLFSRVGDLRRCGLRRILGTRSFMEGVVEGRTCNIAWTSSALRLETSFDVVSRVLWSVAWNGFVFGGTRWNDVSKGNGEDYHAECGICGNG